MNNLQFEHIRNHKFSDLEQELPLEIQRLAAKQFLMLQENPWHPSLHFKKVSGLWSLRITGKYRALGYEENGKIIWHWIDIHKVHNSLF